MVYAVITGGISYAFAKQMCSSASKGADQSNTETKSSAKSSLYSRMFSCFGKAHVDKSLAHIERAKSNQDHQEPIINSLNNGITIKEKITSVLTSNYADGFIQAKNQLDLPKRVKYVRVSALKKEPQVQSTTINLHVHELTVEKTTNAQHNNQIDNSSLIADCRTETQTKLKVVRSGAPATHGRKQMTKLLKELEKDLGIPTNESLGPTERYEKIKKAKEAYKKPVSESSSSLISRIFSCFKRAHVDKEAKIEANLKELEFQLNCSVAQMLAKFEAAIQDKIDSTNPIVQDKLVHLEHSMLSPTTYHGLFSSCKEESLLMQTEMAIDYINENYVIDIHSKGLVEKTSYKLNEYDDNQKSHSVEIAIILMQTAVNEYTGYGQKTEDRINLKACDNLKKLLSSNLTPETKDAYSNEETKTEGSLQETQPLLEEGNDNISSDIQTAQKLINDNKSSPRKVADLSISRYLRKAAQSLGATYGVLCKSGKDRTAQGVADLLVEEIKDIGIGSDPEQESVRKAVQKGLSYSHITTLNTGKPAAYAFNFFQRRYLPEDLRPPAECCGSVAS